MAIEPIVEICPLWITDICGPMGWCEGLHHLPSWQSDEAGKQPCDVRSHALIWAGRGAHHPRGRGQPQPGPRPGPPIWTRPPANSAKKCPATNCAATEQAG
jgi:hypothetical protein